MDAAFFRNNRHNVTEQVAGSAVVLTAYSAQQLSGDAAAPFQQEANFWYVTGIREPDWRLILTPDRHLLVAPDVSEIHRVFDGGLSSEAAQAISGVDEVITYAAAKKLIRELARTHTHVYTLGDDPHASYYSFVLNPASRKLWTMLRRQFNDVRDIRPVLAKLRALKQSSELDALRRAARLTVDAFSTVKEQLATYAYEYEVEAAFTYEFRRRNAVHAYQPIVASGLNACTLHYGANEAALEQSSLLLLDIGAQVDGYPADITRTYAIGTPTQRQRAVHAAVRQAQQTIIALLRPGLSMEEYQAQSDVSMREALRSLGLPDSEYRRYFPHAVSHGLGIDVHDTLGGYREFQPGMVVTVEPGIYITQEAIGVRIEDDILITASGHENMSNTLSTDM